MREPPALGASWDAPGYDNRQRVLEKLELERLRKELEMQARAAFVPDYAVVPAPPPIQVRVFLSSYLSPCPNKSFSPISIMQSPL